MKLKKPSKKELKDFVNKYGYFACYEKHKNYLQLNFKCHKLELRYYYE